MAQLMVGVPPTTVFPRKVRNLLSDSAAEGIQAAAHCMVESSRACESSRRPPAPSRWACNTAPDSVVGLALHGLVRNESAAKVNAFHFCPSECAPGVSPPHFCFASYGGSSAARHESHVVFALRFGESSESVAGCPVRKWEESACEAPKVVRVKPCFEFVA